jgi:hypothetical protein
MVPAASDPNSQIQKIFPIFFLGDLTMTLHNLSKTFLALVLVACG